MHPDQFQALKLQSTSDTVTCIRESMALWRHDTLVFSSTEKTVGWGIGHLLGKSKRQNMNPRTIPSCVTMVEWSPLTRFFSLPAPSWFQAGMPLQRIKCTDLLHRYWTILSQLCSHTLE
ncbi:hypothetical protein KIL84_014984 [Mauremys mutica]|uniref:Uncharacterized protein n=1 Tax=Mauremys mutica TaxID=74926 RepID=A0A9D3XQR1_9SAUR|nr:hypothetical protein KIL84_014984 [Mauremys mutica]